jgi:hypothetical protein
MAKRQNPNKAKLHRSYTVEEAANLFAVHKNTIRAWIKTGLPVMDDQRPLLILGKELRHFITLQNLTNKRKTKINEIYCLACKTPKIPALGFADYMPDTPTRGRLTALCPTCNNIINKFIKESDLALLKGKLEVSHTTY